MLKLCSDLNSGDYDAIVLVAPSLDCLKEEKLKQSLSAICSVDCTAEKGVFVAPSELASRRIVFSGTGLINRDYDDVRIFAKAAEAGVKKAVSIGSKSPLLVIENPSHESKYGQAQLVGILGALQALYVPLETREGVPEKAIKCDKLGVFSKDSNASSRLELANALEEGRRVSRDIGGSDPERMAAPRVEEYVKSCFDSSNDVKVSVVKGQDVFEKEYPCFAAVNRAASGVERHDGRVIWLTYEPKGPISSTVMLVGKGVTYDTGGADIKAGGVMAGMSRDKCGAADVAGFFKTISLLKPQHLKVVGAMAMVRNSVGNNCYVSDEIIKTRSGVRIRVGNTDAEGRMAMVDVLAHMKELALKEKNPHLLTVATLTGHACLALGPYTAVMDNGPAKGQQFAQELQNMGEIYGDPFEISTMRREDYDFIMDKSGEYVDVLQCNNAASSRTPRGHQFPGAFLHFVSGLHDYQAKADQPLKYSHVDVAGSSGELPHPTTASSVVALTMQFAMKGPAPPSCFAI